jgi:hypothetical protein
MTGIGWNGRRAPFSALDSKKCFGGDKLLAYLWLKRWPGAMRVNGAKEGSGLFGRRSICGGGWLKIGKKIGGRNRLGRLGQAKSHEERGQWPKKEKLSQQEIGFAKWRAQLLMR